MARIGIALSGIERSLLNRLAEANAATAMSSLRLASGKNINTPSDDLSTFITLSRYQSRLTTVTATMSNVTAANSMMSDTQATLGSMLAQLTTIRTELAKDEQHTLTPDQRAAAQAKIDTAINQINALATSSINGRRLLDGSADYLVSGQNYSQVADVRVYSKPFGASVTISGKVTEAATQASLVYTGAAGQATEDATFTLTGDLGSVSLTVTASENLTDVAQRINDNSHKTGIVATVVDDQLTMKSVDYGSHALAKVAVTSGQFIVPEGGTAAAAGTDAVVEINGHTYDDQRVNGNRVTVNQNGLAYQIQFASGFTGDFDSITVSGEALTFAVDPNLSHRATLAIPGLQANRLGGLSGTLDQLYTGGTHAGLGNNTSQAIRIVDEAIGELTVAKGSVDGFTNAALTSSSQLLSALQEDLAMAIAQTDGFDEQKEKLLQAKSEALASNAIASLTILADQRMNIVRMIKHLAGLD